MPSKPTKPAAQEVEIVTDADVTAAELTGIAAAISRSREIIHKHEQACHETTLEHYLDAGQMLARAQEIFTLSASARAALGGNAKAALSTVDKAAQESPDVLANRGFSAWLAKALPDLKRPTAIRYATAFRSLGLPLAAKPSEIRAKLKTLNHKADKAGEPRPTLAALLKAASKPKREQTTLNIEAPRDSKKLRLEDARESVALWKDQFEKMVRAGVLDDLDKPGLEDLKEFIATARDRVNKRLR